MKTLVVEDDRATRKGLEEILAESSSAIQGVATLAEARAALSEFRPDICVADLTLPDGNGIDFIREARAHEASPEVIVLTGDSSIDTAVEAMKAGAFDYLVKPLKPAQIGVVLKKLLEKRDLEQEVDDLKGELARSGRFLGMVGVSDPMQELFGVISRVAKSDAPVMITGESGTGKEVAAVAIHELSKRRAKPFVAVNCGAVSVTLIESELFGHEKGAFTGADRRRTGYFEMANGGTLFLDEVTEMPEELQVKLLRVLETRSLRRVGGNEELKVDIRILSSTNRSPEEAIKEGKLREDFYYRLNVFPLALPPLRERRDDIAPLARHFLEVIDKKEKAGVREIEPKALEELNAHDWPGNVRELRNVIHRAYVLSNPPAIGAQAVRSVLGRAGAGRAAGSAKSLRLGAGESLAAAERRFLALTLDSVRGDLRKAASLLKIGVPALKTKLKRYKIKS
jgi:DNA-binding NtrC family response regulator